MVFHMKQISYFMCLLHKYPYFTRHFKQKGHKALSLKTVLYKHYQHSYPQFSTKSLINMGIEF